MGETRGEKHANTVKHGGRKREAAEHRWPGSESGHPLFHHFTPEGHVYPPADGIPAQGSTMFEEAIRYPAKGDDAVKTILIGGVLGLLGFLIIPAIIVQGYVLRMMQAVIRGEESPPVFDDWMGLFVDGVKLVVVSLVYAVIPIVLGAALVLTTSTSTGIGPRIAAPFAITGVGLVILVSLVIYYFVPAALANLAVEGDIGAAFDFDAIRELVTTDTYLTTWLVALGIGILGAIIALALELTVVGIIAVPFVSFYANVAVFYLFARAYREVLGASAGPVPS